MPPELNEWPLWRSELSGSNGVIGRKTDMRATRRIRQMMNALIYFERDSEVRLCGVAFE